MNKSNNRLKRFAVVFALCCASGSSGAAETVVVGPVEKVSSQGGTITVLGQTFRTTSAAGLPVGAYAVVVGERSQGGALIAKSVKALGSPYVAGASQVYVLGTIDRYSFSTGLVQISGLKVLASEALAAVSAPTVAVGETIELVGTQAVSGGPVWATALAAPKAIQGTGALAIQGTGALAIQGTGSLAIQGTGAQAIQGTGTQAIQGTGTQAIQGTGSLAIQGTGALAIQGTGARAIQGTGTARAIQGTG